MPRKLNEERREGGSGLSPEANQLSLEVMVKMTICKGDTEGEDL